ncbi:MAG: YgfZ/GcvT domain-containing protein [Candidatus Puniceispirillaceae bacterium]
MSDHTTPLTGCVARDDTRQIFRVGGAEATDFLQALITTNVETLADGQTCAGALLTPQGRVLVDFMVSRTDGGFLIECDAGRADELFTRLRRYRLRRPIELTRETELAVWVIWGIDKPPAGARRDARHPDLGWRMIAAQNAWAQDDAVDIVPAPIENWHLLRISAAVPQGPVDLVPERALMLEAGLDRLGALDFQKGCYIGQEVTARTHYRGLVKRRIAPFAVTGAGCASGATITSGDRAVGTVLSAVCGPEGGMCLAAMKLSDLHKLQDSGDAVDIDGATARLALPDWMLPLPSPARTDSS